MITHGQPAQLAVTVRQARKVGLNAFREAQQPEPCRAQ